MKLSHRHVKALRHMLGLGWYEDPADFPWGIGTETLQDLVVMGYAEHGVDEGYGNTGYKITDAGKQVYSTIINKAI